MSDAQGNTEHARAVWSRDYETHRPRLHAYAWRIIGDSAAAEDVVQNVFVKILRLAPDPESVATRLGYLLRSVRNASIDWLKKQKRLPTVSIDSGDRREWQEMVAPERDADADAENDEYRLAVSIVMRRLNKRENTLLRLFLEGYKCEEIAARMNEDKRAVSYDLNAMRTKVRYQLQKHLGLTGAQNARRKREG